MQYQVIEFVLKNSEKIEITNSSLICDNFFSVRKQINVVFINPL